MKKITIKSLQAKSTIGTLEFTCTLMYGNLRTARCTKTADSNEVEVEFLSNPLKKLVEDHIRTAHSTHTARSGSSDTKSLLAALIMAEVDSEIATQRNDKLSAKKTLFRLKGDKPGAFRSTSEKYSPESCESLQKKYSSRLAEIYIPSKYR